MRTAPRTLASLLLVCWLGCASAAAEDDRVELDSPRNVQGLRLADVDGDGLADVLALEGRALRVYRGRAGRLPAASPSWEGAIPPGVTFVDVAPRPPGEGAALLTFGTAGPAHLPLLDGAAARPLAGGEPLVWRDQTKASFARLIRSGGVLLPGRDGWLYEPAGAGAPIRLQATPRHDVRAPGPFLEDSCAVTIAWPDVFVGTPAHAGPGDGAVALWTLDGSSLVAQSKDARVTYDLAFLLQGADGGDTAERQLVDLDGDGRPEVMLRLFNNREARYGFFHTRPVQAQAVRTGPTHKPAASTIYLAGFQLPPHLVDLDGDGRKDLVVTSIQINAANTLRALGSGQVGAETRAFLNRWSPEAGRYFEEQADATVKSDIDVGVRFNYAGTIEVERSFTILVEGDYDGDGRRDLAIRTGADALTIRNGRSRGVWEPEGRRVTTWPLGSSVDVDGSTADLDGDGRDEIVLHYRSPPGGHDRLRVLRPGP